MSTTATESDRELLSRFVRRGDEQAFASIVHRYSGMVHGVCVRVLHDGHAAEDAFQAVFLVLAKSARRIRKQTALASWLHGVAYRVALRALAQRQRRRERISDMDQMTAHPPIRDVGEAYEQQLLDDELEHLPPKYREPLVLHYLQGLTNNQVAHRLGLSVTAVEGRIKRGKKELRLRMTRRGVELGAVAVALQATQSAAQSAVVQAIIPGTIKAALAAAHGASGAASANALGLAGKEISMLTTTKLAAGMAISTVAAVLILGATFGTGHSFAEGDSSGAAATVETAISAVSGQSEAADPTRLGTGGTVAPAEMSSSLAQRQARVEIEKRLDGPTEIEFAGNPLRDVVQYLAEVNDIPILIDENALADEGISPDEDITLMVSGVSVRNALELMLENVAGIELDYVVRNEILTITTRYTADRILETVVYPIRDLVQFGWDEPSVAQIIQRTIDPASWARISIVGAAGYGDDYSMMGMEGGGAGGDAYGAMEMSGGAMGSMELGEMQIDRQQVQGLGTIETVPGALVVNQSQRVHRAVANLIMQLRNQVANAQRSGTPSNVSDSAPQNEPLRTPTLLAGMVHVRGNVPPRPPLLRPGSGKDGGILTEPIPDESLLVGTNGGLANVFVYVKNPPDVTVPTADGEVLLNSIGLQFVPHVLSLCTGQTLRLTNGDPVANNVRTNSITNSAMNQVLAPKDFIGAATVFSKPEPTPFRVVDDLHPWRSAWVLPLDHPFVAITDEEGRFEIPGLPAGEIELIVWHERAGYLERKLKVELDPGADGTDIVIEVDAADLQR